MMVDRAKRTPLLADVCLTSRSSMMIRSSTYSQIQQRVRVAQKFVFDEQASLRLAEVIRDIPEFIVREQTFARSPYDVTWIEFEFKPFWEIINKRPAQVGSDKRIGFLIDNDTAYVASDTGDFMPFVYDLHHSWRLAEQQKFCDDVGIAIPDLDMFFWGSTYTKLKSDDRNLLRIHNSVRSLPLQDTLRSKEKLLLSHIVKESYADLRNIIAILLLLNRPSLTSYVNEAPQVRGFVKGKLRQYAAHTVVTIKLDPKPILMHIGTHAESDVEKRVHDVRGTWCHDATYRKGAANGCIHQWIPHPKYVSDPSRFHLTNSGSKERDNWLCTECGGHRWRRDDHRRGNSLEGIVVKTYKVKA